MVKKRPPHHGTQVSYKLLSRKVGGKTRSKKEFEDFLERVNKRAGGKSLAYVKKFYYAFVEELIDSTQKKFIIRLPSFGTFYAGFLQAKKVIAPKSSRNKVKTIVTGFSPAKMKLCFKPNEGVSNFFKRISKTILYDLKDQLGIDENDLLERPITPLEDFYETYHSQDVHEFNESYPLKKINE